ncbi:RAMP superfamily CRISPR-associated protein [Chloroflexus sp. MS-G]|uniref:RAMP superfamily CRISPR-associated protein n=1 Tax=Chloroflexus sp. MS-G TaxID=1521187 RepID=UPI0004DF4433|nr:RAMP superfamily CRISPR-associated protein [Chloroflexus sp. MS-G]
MSAHPLAKSRQLSKRWVIEGDLVLQTPTHLGNGDTDGIVDMPLLLDEATGRALLPGTSLAGALRNYLRERRHGFEKRAPDALIEALFGGEKGDDEGNQSALIIDDALGEMPGIELRDGVRIDPITRTAKIDVDNGILRGYKYDLQLLEAGTTFPLRMELLLSRGNDQQQMKQMLALALHGLEAGEVAIGLRKRRGFGVCRVERWRVTRYDFTKPTDLLAWLAEDHPDWKFAPGDQRSGQHIADLLGVSLERVEDRRNLCRIHAHFIIDGSLLIRAGFGEQDRGPDTVHLHSARPGGARKPVLSGTSLAGALRHRAERILRTIGNAAQATTMIDNMFGPARITSGDKQKARSSRLIVSETVIENPVNLVQNRIRIDRFTGSVHGTGLFNEQPVFGKNDTLVAIDLTLRNPQDAEIGLLLLLLKDLWTGDLPLGGEIGIGRGRLKGVEAVIETPQYKAKPLTISAVDGDRRLTVSDRSTLERYVAALHTEATK